MTLAHDPQTSGGLLAAVARRLSGRSRPTSMPAGVTHWRIGHVEPSSDGSGSVTLA